MVRIEYLGYVESCLSIGSSHSNMSSWSIASRSRYRSTPIEWDGERDEYEETENIHRTMGYMPCTVR